MKPQKFFGMIGHNGETEVISTECPIRRMLEIAGKAPFEAEQGLDIDTQTGIQRPMDDARALEIARVFEDLLARGYPIENGSVVFACTQNEMGVRIIDKDKNFGEITISKEPPLIDRQHTGKAFRIAQENPKDFPKLSAYVEDMNNTITTRFIKCTTQEALRRNLAMNTGQKPWTPLEKLMGMVLDAKINESQGVKSHEKERPSLVMFQFCHNVSKDPNHPLFGLLPVDAGVKYDPKKTPTNLAKFVDAMWPFYSILEKEMEEFKGMTIEEQAEVVNNLTLPFWTTVKSFLAASFEETSWYNFNTVRKGAPLLAECCNGFFRLWIEHRRKKSTIPLLAAIHGTSITQFAEKVIPRFLQDSDPSYPWKNEQFWTTNGGAFGKKILEEGDDETCKYMWSTLKPNSVGHDTWNSFVRSIQSHAAKLRYLERKGPVQAKNVQERRSNRNKKAKGELVEAAA